MDTSVMNDRVERLEREIAYHAAHAARFTDVQATPPAIVDRYRRNRHWRIFPKEYVYHRMGDLRGKQVLDYGCGTGEITTQLALLGAARATGFDLSPELIAVARRRADLDGVSDRVDLLVADGENVVLPGEAFDFVVVYALLHHTDVAPVLDRVLGALKPGGRAFIVEPIAFSPLLQRLRNAAPVPKHVSPDERQLSLAEVDEIRSRFRSSEIVYFCALGRLQRLFLGDPPTRTSAVAWGATRAIHYLDRVLFSLPGFWRFAGTALIVGEK